MNDADTATLPQWPRRWPEKAFPPKATAVTVVLAIGLGTILLFAGGQWLAIMSPVAMRHRTPPIVPAVVLQLIVELAIVACLLGALPRLTGFSFAQIGFRPPSYRAIVTAIGGGIVMAVLVDGGASLIESWLHATHEQAALAMFKGIHDPATFAFFAAFAIVFAPVMEELIFRVFFFNLGLRYGGFWLGAAVSASLFALAHLDVFAFFPLLLGGIVLSSVYYRTQNAFASMITHGLFNALTVVGLLAAPSLAK